ncbi:MAG: TetR/AcrR family transcriptional regulator C-terminal domain-containing protein [Actinomycetota bacterium]
MGRRPTLQRSDFVAAAIEYADEVGLDGLTWRTLGTRMGLSHTAAYSHFRDKNELLAAMINTVLSGIPERVGDVSGLTPRETLAHIARSARAVLADHPRIIPALPVANSFGESTLLVQWVSALLLAGGLPEHDHPIVYQAFEAYVVGTAVHDFAGAPNHLERRRLRYRAVGTEPFDVVSRTTDEIARHNELAFERGLQVIIDGFLPAPPSST